MVLIRLMLVATMFAVGGCTPETTNDPVDALFAEWDSEQAPGCSVAAMRDGEIVHIGSYGMANLDHAVPVGPDTVFHVASVSKQFTAAAILLLAQDGKLSLDDEVRDHVPELPDFGRSITIRHLIYHTSGLRDQWQLLSMTGWRYSQDRIINKDVLAVISQQKHLNFDPGAEYLYSNTGYTLLAEIVARVSGQSFREFTTARIFEPLGMNSTFFRDDFREIVPNQAYGYVADGKDGAYRLSVTNFDTVGATSLLTTATDLLKWQDNFEHNTVGGDGFTDAMLGRGTLNDGTDIDYAFGLVHAEHRGTAVISHGGGDAGYRSFLARFPEARFNVAIACNTVVNTGAKAQALADLLIPEHLDPIEAVEAISETDVAIDPVILERYARPYWNESRSLAVRFGVEDNKLVAWFGDTPLELTSVSATRFRFAVGTLVDFSGDGDTVALFVDTPRETALVRRAAYDPAPTDLAGYVGTYRSEELDVPYRIALHDDGHLTVNWLKRYDIALAPHARDIFTSKSGTFQFFRGEDGAVSGFAFTDGRIRNLVFERI